MTVDDVALITKEALYLIIKVAAPPLIVSLIIGLIVSILQTVTSIQEQTLTFVPKILGIFLTLIILGHWMLNSMIEYMVNLWGNFTAYIR